MAQREVYYEVTRVGAYLKVTAIDSLTGTEASVVGPATGNGAQLKITALNKLKYLLEKRAAGGGGGGIVA